MSCDTKDITAEKKPEIQDMYPLQIIRGLAFPSPVPLAEVVESVLDYKPTADDVFIVTYPKCGTTWTQFLVWEILNKGAVPPSPNQVMFKYVPFLEMTGLDVIKELTPPRAMKTHLPFQLQPYSPQAKYINVIRNPWDCCVSYYNHYLMYPNQLKLSFDQFVDLFMKGGLGWGDFFDHVQSWFAHRNDPNVLLFTYEEMKKDIRKALLKIAKFLGESYYESLQDEAVIEKCIKHSSFKYMQDQGMFFPRSMGDEIGPETMKAMTEVERSTAEDTNCYEVPFFRKGATGDWKNHFSQEQIKAFNTYMMGKVKNTELENYWLPAEETTSL